MWVNLTHIVGAQTSVHGRYWHAAGKYISYLRVSTDKQSRSGLGLATQRAAIDSYLNGGRWTLAAEYVETESGRRTDCRQLAKALASAFLT
jgi:DNA invertase Pin-like site-specific DNA recombinase